VTGATRLGSSYSDEVKREQDPRKTSLAPSGIQLSKLGVDPSSSGHDTKSQGEEGGKKEDQGGRRSKYRLRGKVLGRPGTALRGFSAVRCAQNEGRSELQRLSSKRVGLCQ